MLTILLQLILLYAKLKFLVTFSWLIVLLPSMFLLKFLTFYIYSYIRGLEDGHPRFYRYLRMQLFFAFILSYSGVIFVDLYLDTPVNQRNLLFVKMLPFYGVLLIVSSIFIYLLPGLCDPENHTEKRVPFLILSYLLMLLAFMVIININEKILSSINGYLLYSPVFFTLAFHMITVTPYF